MMQLAGPLPGAARARRQDIPGLELAGEVVERRPRRRSASSPATA